MTTNPESVTVIPMDFGVDCALIPVPDSGPILLVRPPPYQSFDAAVERANRVLPYSPDEVRALLRPHFTPISSHAEDQPVLPTQAATKVRRRVRTTERRHRVALWLIAATIGVVAGLGVGTVTGEDPPPPTATGGPLNDLMMADILTAWGVNCAPSGDGWTAACQGPTVGGFTIQSYRSHNGIVLSSRVGTGVLSMRLIGRDAAGPGTVANTYAHIRAGYGNIPGWQVTLLVSPDAPTIVMWGDADLVEPLTAKAVNMGYTEEGNPPSGGFPSSARAAETP